MRNEIEEVTCYHWPLATGLAGTTVWPNTVGFLQGFGQSRRRLVIQEFNPHLVVSGRGTYRSAGQELAVEAGDVFATWPGVPYHFFESPEEPWGFHWFQLLGPGIEDFGRLCGFGPDKFLLRPRRPERVLEPVRELFALYADEAGWDPCRALELVFRFAAELRHETGAESPVQASLSRKAVALLETEVAHGLNVGELCGRLRVSRSSLLTAFRTELGTTPQSYLTGLRLRRAEALLLRSDWKLSTIAAACGFHGEKYFLRSFKASHGLTPSQWRAAQPT